MIKQISTFNLFALGKKVTWSLPTDVDFSIVNKRILDFNKIFSIFRLGWFWLFNSNQVDLIIEGEQKEKIIQDLKEFNLKYCSFEIFNIVRKKAQII